MRFRYQKCSIELDRWTQIKIWSIRLRDFAIFDFSSPAAGRRRPRARGRGRPRAGLVDLARARVRFCFIARYRSRLRRAIRALPVA